jgi:hypothetical protein
LTPATDRETIEATDRGDDMTKGFLLRRNRSSTRPESRRALRLAAVSVVVCSAVLVAAPAAGAGVLDQSQPVLTNSASFASSTIVTAQTFTAGLSGRLDQVDLAVTRAGASAATPLNVEIRTVAAGLPTSVVLGSTTVPTASFPVGSLPNAFVSVPLPAPVPVSAGTQYAVVLSSANCGFANCFNWNISLGTNPYPSGAAFFSQSGAPFAPFTASDFAFKTYVAQAPTAKAQCKRGGWRQFTSPRFKNQGQCIAYVNHHNGKGKDDAKQQAGKKNGHGKKP